MSRRKNRNTGKFRFLLGSHRDASQSQMRRNRRSLSIQPLENRMLLAAEVRNLALSSFNGNMMPRITATVLDSGGTQLITGAEFFFDAMPGPEVRGTALFATDGAFDETSEPVVRILSAAQVAAISEGSHVLYVRGFMQGGSVGAFASLNFVKDTVNDPPVFGSFVTTPKVLKTRSVSVMATASDPDSTVLTYSLAGAPSWASIDSVSGQLTLNPGFEIPAGEFAFDVVVRDNGFRGLGTNPLQSSITVTAQVYDAAIEGDDLIVYGSSADDVIQVSGTASTAVTVGGQSRPVLLGPAADSPTAATVVLPPSGKIVVVAGNGKNLVTIDGSIAARVTGGSGIDRLRGGSGNDSLFGLGGPDVIDGSGGDDSVVGGEGDDWLVGGPGANLVFGGIGSDRLIQTGNLTFDLVQASATSPEASLASLLASAPSGDLDFVLSANRLEAKSGAVQVVLVDMPDQDVEYADLVGGSGDNRFAIDGWAGDGSFVARSGWDTLAVKGTSGIVDVLTITDTTLDFGTVHFDISGFDNLETNGITGEDVINVSGALLRSYTNTGDDADISINLTGANFESLINFGNQTNIRIDITGADFAAFTSLVNSGSGVRIDITGANFETLLNTGSNTIISIDIAGADFVAFTSLKNEGDDVDIDVNGADFGSILNLGQNVDIDLSGADFGSFVNQGGGVTIDVTGADFDSLSNTGDGATIDIDGADFDSLVNLGGDTTIIVSGADFGSLSNMGDGATIDIDGADFGSLVNQGGGVTIDISGADFDSIGNTGDGATIDISGADFGSLVNQGSGVSIDISGADFTSIGNNGDDVTIDVSGADFESLTNLGDAVVITIDPTGAEFSTFVRLQNSGDDVTIDVSGAVFEILLNSGDGAMIDATGADFETLLNVSQDQLDLIVSGADFGSISGIGTLDASIDISGAEFDSLVNGGNGSTIDISGAEFSTLVNLGSGVEIDATGANFEKLAGLDPGLDLSGADFGTLANYGDGAKIDISGAVFSVILNEGNQVVIDAGIATGADFSELEGPDPTLDSTGAHFGVLVNRGSEVVIDASGADFENLVNQSGGDGARIDVSGADFESLSNLGDGTTIDASGADFGSLSNQGDGTTIDASGADFGSLVNGGSGVVIDASGADFDSLSDEGDGTTIDASGAQFDSLTSHGDEVSIDAGGAVFQLFAVYGDGSYYIFVQGGPEANTVILEGSQHQGVQVEGGAGGDVFVILASNSSIAVFGQAGDDRFVIGGVSESYVSIDGGTGNDQVLFSGDVMAVIALTEQPDADSDTLDFSSFTGGPISIDLAQTVTQNVAEGLSLILSSGLGVENVIGTDKADTIRGNLRNNSIQGADPLDDRIGKGAPANGTVQVVVLDFATFTNAEAPGLNVPIPGAIDSSAVEYVYSAEEQVRILEGVKSIYAGFLASAGGFIDFRTSADGLTPGTYATVYFNRSRFPRPNAPAPGGDSSQVDFRNTNLGGWATVQINGLLGGPGQPEASSDHFVAASIWMAAHEFGHLLGLRHSDSFGPIGFGISMPPGINRFAPVYPGPTGGFETNSHVMATPAATGFTLTDLVSPTYFGERELVKLAYFRSVPSVPGQSSLLVGETSASATGQSISLVPVDVPQGLPSGLNGPKLLAAAATTVLGAITSSGQIDRFVFEGRTGDLMNIEVFSRGILADRYQDTLDTVIRVLKDGVVVAQFEGQAVNDDQFEFDSSIVDLYLPSDGVYTIEITAFAGETGISPENETGNYELFLFRFDTANRTDDGDLIEGRGGDDVVAGGEGNDRYVFAVGNLGNDILREDVRLESAGLPESQRDAGDILDFSALAGAMSIDLASITQQIVSPGILGLRLSSASGFEDVIMSASGGTARGNARINRFVDGLGDDTFEGRGGDDDFLLTGGLDQVDGGEGNDVVRYLGNGSGGLLMKGGSGIDTLDFSSRTTGVTLDLSNASSQQAGGGLVLTIPLPDLENVYGSSTGVNVLTGNALSNLLIGGSGFDTITGGPGDDILVGLNGDDMLVGSEGLDILFGGRGADRLVGSSGDDILLSGRSVYDEIVYDVRGRNVNVAYFDAILSVWRQVSTARFRRNILRQASTGLLRDGMVFDDGDIDRLTGSQGDNYYLVGTGDIITDQKNTILKDPLQP